MRRLIPVLLLWLLPSMAAAAGPAQAVWLFDAESGLLLRTEHAGSPADQAALARVGPGSTLKPFLLLAALQGGLNARQTVLCPSRPIAAPPETRCWLAAGHGATDLRRGVAHSCSTYARHACRHVDADRYRRLLSEAGFHDLPDAANFRAMGCEGWMGAQPGIAATAAELAQAYRWLWKELRGRKGAGPAALRAGLTEACLTGTAAGVRRGRALLSVAGKTGTSAGPSGRQVGVFVGLTPVEKPRRIIVVMMLDGDGATAAELAGRVLAKQSFTAP
ncbi:MAG: penicillin-binding transpeptidase domain-containing protein [Candidatus Lernaella stagnicola]|nr:penicillin-binding transpeptidase domain-containing protein [Candidatus Lernaella stagnicola]